MEMSLAAATSNTASASALHDVIFLQPLALVSPDLHVECAIAEDRLKIRSGRLSSDTLLMANDVVHCSGILLSSDYGRLHLSLAVVHSRCDCIAETCTLYDGFDVVGLQYGPMYRTLVQVWAGHGEALSRLCVRSTQEGIHVHPADLDDALCTSALINSDTGAGAGANKGGGEARLPFAVAGA